MSLSIQTRTRSAHKEDLNKEVCNIIIERTNAQWFGNECDFTLGSNFNAQFTKLHDGARLFAFLTTFSGFAFVAAHNGNAYVRFLAFVAAAMRSFLLGRHRNNRNMCIYFLRSEKEISGYRFEASTKER
jgi:hypothetical protein